ncbi:MAG: hypothetical protein QW112_03385 [Candidatus Micrarchaeia archaeon]
METRQYERSKSFRKLMKRTPGGKLVTHAKRREKKEKNKCEICSTTIKVSDKKKKAFANLCNRCTSKVSVLKARIAEGIPIENVDLRYIKYVK